MNIAVGGDRTLPISAPPKPRHLAQDFYQMHRVKIHQSLLMIKKNVWASEFPW